MFISFLCASASLSPWVTLYEHIATDIRIHKTRRGSAESELFRFHDIKI